jgi:hypothetical protein
LSAFSTLKWYSPFSRVARDTAQKTKILATGFASRQSA